MEEEIEKDSQEIETVHIQSQSENCNSQSCLKNRKKYVQILDVDRYIESLNDWD